MKCPKCGNEHSDEVKFCKECGSALGITKVKWYKKDWVALLSFFIFAPVGIFLVWKYHKLNVFTKILFSIIGIIIILIQISIYAKSIEFSRGDLSKSLGVSDTGIKGLKSSTLFDSVELNVGNTKTGYFRVDGTRDFTLDDIQFISSDDTVATFEYESTALTVYVYYTITGVSPGTAAIYSQTSDGVVKSDEIIVTVKGEKEEDVSSTQATINSKENSHFESSVNSNTTLSEIPSSENTASSELVTPPTSPNVITGNTSYIFRRNENATVSIEGTPDVEYTIKVKYPSGTISTAEGLEKKTADSNGDISWMWHI